MASAVMMYLYFGKKRRAEEQQKMAIEKERADMERETERQLEQQRAMEVESHYSESLTSMAMEVESLRMKVGFVKMKVGSVKIKMWGLWNSRWGFLKMKTWVSENEGEGL